MSEVSLRVTDTLLFSAPSMVTDKICYRKAVSVKCLVPQDRSQTLISELPQQLQTVELCQRVPVDGYRVLVSWFDSELQILTEIRQKVELKLVQEN